MKNFISKRRLQHIPILHIPNSTQYWMNRTVSIHIHIVCIHRAAGDWTLSCVGKRILRAIKELQTKSLPLDKSISIIDNVVEKLNQIRNPRIVAIKKKLKEILSKNEGYSTPKEINCIFTQNRTSDTLNFSNEELLSFKHCPTTSVEVERIFSQYKSVFRDNRKRFLVDNLKKHLIIKCNFEHLM